MPREVRRATTRQTEYLEILLNDCGFSDLKQRNGFLSRECQRDIVFVSDVGFYEAQSIIEYLKDLKARRKTTK